MVILNYNFANDAGDANTMYSNVNIYRHLINVEHYKA